MSETDVINQVLQETEIKVDAISQEMSKLEDRVKQGKADAASLQNDLTALLSQLGATITANEDLTSQLLADKQQISLLEDNIKAKDMELQTERQKNSDLASKEQEYAQTIKDLTEETQRLTVKLQNADSQLQQERNVSEGRRRELDDLRLNTRDYNDLKSKADQLADVQAKLSSAQTEIVQLRAEVAQAQKLTIEVAASKEESQKAKDALAEIQKQIDQRTEEIRTLETTIQLRDEQLVAAKKNLDDSEAQLTIYKDREAKALQQLNDQTSSFNRLQKDLEQRIQEASDTYQAQLDSLNKELQDARKELKTNQQRTIDAENKLLKVQQDETKLRSDIEKSLKMLQASNTNLEKAIKLIQDDEVSQKVREVRSDLAKVLASFNFSNVSKTVSLRDKLDRLRNTYVKKENIKA